LVISLDIIEDDEEGRGSAPDLNVSFPELTEITDYLMIYGSKALPRLTNVFPNLAVIRGNNLMEVN